MRRRTVESSLCWSLALVFIGTIGTYAQTDEYTIPLLSGSVIPDPLPPGGPQSVLKGKCLTGHIILQFRNELTPEQRGQLARAGIVLHEWLGGRAYSATVPRPPDELPPATAHSPIRDLVRSNAKFKKGDRLAPQLVSGSGKPLPEWAKVDHGDPGASRYHGGLG